MRSQPLRLRHDLCMILRGMHIFYMIIFIYIRFDASIVANVGCFQFLIVSRVKFIELIGQWMRADTVNPANTRKQTMKRQLKIYIEWLNANLMNLLWEIEKWICRCCDFPHPTTSSLSQFFDSINLYIAMVDGRNGQGFAHVPKSTHRFTNTPAALDPRKQVILFPQVVRFPFFVIFITRLYSVSFF